MAHRPGATLGIGTLGDGVVRSGTRASGGEGQAGLAPAHGTALVLSSRQPWVADPVGVRLRTLGLWKAHEISAAVRALPPRAAPRVPIECCTADTPKDRFVGFHSSTGLAFEGHPLGAQQLGRVRGHRRERALAADLQGGCCARQRRSPRRGLPPTMSY